MILISPPPFLDHVFIDAWKQASTLRKKLEYTYNTQNISNLFGELKVCFKK